VAGVKSADREGKGFRRKALTDLGYVLSAIVCFALFAFPLLNIRKHPSGLRHGPFSLTEVVALEVLFFALSCLCAFLLYQAIKRFMRNFER
jgi:hypothetical protein